MNNRMRHGLFLVIGAYLGYTGITLIMDVMAIKPSNYIWYIVAGVFFVAVAVWVVIRSLKGLTKDDVELEKEIDEEIKDEIGQIEAAEKDLAKKDAADTKETPEDKVEPETPESPKTPEGEQETSKEE